jgi:RNA recognition motif-containing protein
MARRLYVGNLPYSLTDNELRALFESYGTVVEATVIIDKPSGKSKGFGFVEMGTDAEAAAAAEKLDGFEIKNREIRVSEAKAREPVRAS